jgi:hypothetical protein
LFSPTSSPITKNSNTNPSSLFRPLMTPQREQTIQLKSSFSPKYLQIFGLRHINYTSIQSYWTQLNNN